MAMHLGVRGPGHLSRGGVASAAAAAYRHQGVSFTPDFSLEYAVGTLPDAPTMLFTVRFRGAAGSAGSPLMSDGRGMMNKLIMGSDSQDGSHDAEHPIGSNPAIIDNSAGNNGGGVFRAAVGDASVLTNNGFLGTFAPLLANCKNNEYVEMTVAVRVDLAHNAKLGAMALDGVQVNLFAEPGTWASGTIKNSLQKFMINVWKAAVQVGGDVDIARAYVTRLSSATGVLDPDHTVGFAAGFLAKIYTPGLGAVDFGADGTALGVSTPNVSNAPDIFHEVRPGGVATDFLTNRGALGNPTVSAYTGTTNTAFKAPYLATVHPNETGGQPYLAWLLADPLLALSDTGTFSAGDNHGQEIRVGDLMVAAFCSGSATARASLAMSSANGAWALLAGTTTGGDFSIFTRTATLADVTANGATWNASTKPTLTWTAGGGFGDAGSNASLSFFVIRKPNGATVTATAATPVKLTPTVANPWVAPAMTPGAAPALLHDYLKAQGWQYEGTGMTIPATMIPRWKTRDALGGCNPRLFERRCLTTSAIGTRTYTTDISGNPGVLISVMYT